MVDHYQRRLDEIQKRGWSQAMGYEPGTHHRSERVDDLTSASWKSVGANIDIRHTNNLSHTRWNQNEFRNKQHGWIEGSISDIPGWDTSKGILNAVPITLDIEK